MIYSTITEIKLMQAVFFFLKTYKLMSPSLPALFIKIH
jgi:hypothetical protein